MTRPFLHAACLAALPLGAMAHDGHGAQGVHWHATDTWGFVVTLALVGVAIWASRRK
ncbi:MAG: hypothetical protein KF891_15245 [Rhizobacter sp.]|nr:hypothetical protein [Rhizobacter sp.]